MKLILSAVALLLATHFQFLSAQSFYATYDPSPGNTVYFGGFQRLLPTPDNGFVAMSGVYERVVAKLNANMEVEWAYLFDTPGSQTNYGLYDITLSNDGKILVLGFGGGAAANSFVAKMELDGTLLWKKDIASNHSVCGYYLNGKQILNAYDNGFLILGGTSEGRSMAVRMDENGNALWGKVYEDTSSTGSYRISNGVRDGNSSYLLASSMQSFSLLKIDDNGNLLSNQHYDDGRSASYPNFLIKNGSGEYIAVGLTRDVVNNDRRQILCKFNSNHNLLWHKEITVDTNFEMFSPYSVFEMPNNEIVVLGYVRDLSVNKRRTQVSRFDQNGNHLGTSIGWDAGNEYLYGGTYQNGFIYLAGISLYDRNMIARLDLDGTGMCNDSSVSVTTMDLTSTTSNPLVQLGVSSMPVIVTNSTWNLVSYSYTRTVRCGNPVVSIDQEIDTQWKVYPVPAETDFILQHPVLSEGNISMFDLSGKEVWRGTIAPNTSETRVSRNNWPAGIYVLRAEGDGLIHHQKVTLR